MAGGGSHGADKLAAIARERIQAVELDPELMIEARRTLAASLALPRRKRPGGIAEALLTYAEFYGLDPDEILGESRLIEMAALSSRLSAPGEVIEQAGVAADPSRLAAVAEAACTAPPDRQGGPPAFQPLDFHAALARAERGRVRR